MLGCLFVLLFFCELSLSLAALALDLACFKVVLHDLDPSRIQDTISLAKHPTLKLMLKSNSKNNIQLAKEATPSTFLKSLHEAHTEPMQHATVDYVFLKQP